MAVLDSVEKVEAAYRLLNSDSLSAEQRAELTAEMQRIAPAIQLAAKPGLAGKMPVRLRNGFADLPEDLRGLAVDLHNRRIDRENVEENARAAAGTVSAAAGIPDTALKWSKAVTDLVGWDGASDWLQNARGDVTEQAVALNKDVRARRLGRPLSPTEEEQAEADSLWTMKAAGVASEVAAGMGAGGASLALRAKGPLSGLIGGIVTGAVEGGIWGYLTSDAEGETAAERRLERMGSVKMGAAIGGPAGAITGALGGTRNLLVNEMRKHWNDADEAWNVAEEFNKGLPKHLAVKLDLGQASGSPVLQAASVAARGDHAQAFFRTQSDTLAQAIAKKLRLALPSAPNVGAELPGKSAAAFGAFDDAVSMIRQRGQMGWQKAIKQARKINGGKDQIVMPNLRGLQFRMQKIAEDLNRGRSISMGENFARLNKEINFAAAKGGATLDDIDTWWLKVNAMAEDPSKAGFVGQVSEKAGRQVDVLAGQLRHALVHEIDKAPADPVLNLVKEGRKAWSKNQEMLQEVTEAVMDKVGLGVNASRDPYTVLMNMKKANVSDVRNAITRIHKLPGGPLRVRQINESLFEGAVQDAMEVAVKKGDATGKLMVGRLAENLGAVAGRSRMAGTLNARQEHNMEIGIKLMRKILNEDAVDGGVITKMVTNLENLAINVVSRNPGFMARLLAGALSRGRGADWLFHSDEGIEILRALQPNQAKYPAVAAQRNAAIILLNNMMYDGASNEQEMEFKQ